MTGLVPLTADLCARAVIAAARSYGDDPVAAWTGEAKSGRRPGRRAVSAAASAIARGLNRSVRGTSRMMGVGDKIVGVQRATKHPAWLAAEAAALRAVETPSNPSSAGVRPPPSPARGEGARVMAAGAVRREVLAALGEDPSTGPELMDLVGVGEGQIRSALSGLVDEGRVKGSVMTAEGWASRTWSLQGAG